MHDFGGATCAAGMCISCAWACTSMHCLDTKGLPFCSQIFCETKRGCDLLTRQLRQDGWPALSIHGDKSQQERDWVLAVRC